MPVPAGGRPPAVRDFVARLNEVWRGAGNPSFARVEAMARNLRHPRVEPLAHSTVQGHLAGDRRNPPRWGLVHALVNVLRIIASQHHLDPDEAVGTVAWWKAEHEAMLAGLAGVPAVPAQRAGPGDVREEEGGHRSAHDGLAPAFAAPGGQAGGKGEPGGAEDAVRASLVSLACRLGTEGWWRTAPDPARADPARSGLAPADLARPDGGHAALARPERHRPHPGGRDRRPSDLGGHGEDRRDDMVPEWFAPYLSLEPAAQRLRAYETVFIPGLLQNEAYAEAVVRLEHGGASPAEIARRVELRMRRQGIMRRPDPVRFWCVLDEAVLHRRYGGRAVQRAQLRHLLDLSDRPNVTIQVLPFAGGGHYAAVGPVAQLRFAADWMPDVIYREHLSGAHYPDDPAAVMCYCLLLDRMSIEARSREETRTILRRVLEDI